MNIRRSWPPTIISLFIHCQVLQSKAPLVVALDFFNHSEPHLEDTNNEERMHKLELRGKKNRIIKPCRLFFSL